MKDQYNEVAIKFPLHFQHAEHGETHLPARVVDDNGAVLFNADYSDCVCDEDTQAVDTWLATAAALLNKAA